MPTHQPHYLLRGADLLCQNHCHGRRCSPTDGAERWWQRHWRERRTGSSDGMAMGVDGAARKALLASGGLSVAVCGWV
jgi:hypothetical protein